MFLFLVAPAKAATASTLSSSLAPAKTREKSHIVVGLLMGQKTGWKKLDKIERDNLD